MTPREKAALRDVVARARLENARPKAKPTPKPVPAPVVRLGRYPRVYPIPGPASIMECPVHQLVVALDEQGRICSACPGCVREADVAIERMAAA